LRRNALPVVSLAVFAVVLTTAAVAFVGWRFAGLPIAAAIAPRSDRRASRRRRRRRVLKEAQAAATHRRRSPGRKPAQRCHRAADLPAAVAMAVGSFSLASDGPLILLSAAGSLVAVTVLARLYLVLTSRIRDAASSTVLQFVSTFAVWLSPSGLRSPPLSPS
jgi:CPA1 family monovalent cation:H+ antiporter